jgi:hypothetical protein
MVAPAWAVTVGQAVVVTSDFCVTGVFDVQTAVSGGTSYTVPADGTLTSFATRSWQPSGSTSIRLMVYRADATTPGNYVVVGVSDVAITLPATAPLSDQTASITPIPVQAGDLIGYYNSGDAGQRCVQVTNSASDQSLNESGPLPSPGQSFAMDNQAAGYRLSISAELGPPLVDYAQTVLADSPAGYWRFGEPSGTLLTDSSPNANDGTYIGGVGLGFPDALVNDPNTAARYDGNNDQGRVPDDNTLDVGNSFAAEGWIKRSSTTKTHELMNKGAGGIQLVVMNAGSGNQVWLRRAGVATIARSSAPIFADGAYHHVVATMNGNGSTARIYVDGADSTVTVSPAQTILNTAFPLTFGSFGSAPSTPTDYDEFALYDTALTGADVTAHYAAATTPAT